MIMTVVLMSGLISVRQDAWVRATTACGAASLALAASVQAVDGVALKAIVDRWALAAPEDKPPLFAAALAVRQIEIGFDALLGLAVGGTLVVFGFTLLAATGTSRWQGMLAAVIGVASGVAGVLIGLGGYSSAAMLATTVSGGLAIVWMVTVGVWAWRLAPAASQAEAPVAAR